MSKKMIELFTTFSNYYNRFEYEVADEENIDFVKRFCNIERLEVEFDVEHEEWYTCHSELPPESEWNEEQHAVWKAYLCACQVAEDPWNRAESAAWMTRRSIGFLLNLCLEEEEQVEDVPGAGK